jgi:hypothetical protein
MKHEILIEVCMTFQKFLGTIPKFKSPQWMTRLHYKTSTLNPNETINFGQDSQSENEEMKNYRTCNEDMN